MAKKRGKAKTEARKRAAPKKPVGKKSDASYGQKAQKAESDDLSMELKSLEELRSQKPAQKEEQEEKPKPEKNFFKRIVHYGTDASVPSWFYMGSIFAAYLFTAYISIFAAIHFESIEYMNIAIVFLFISLASFFLVSGMYFIFEKKSVHSIAPILFFVGITSIMIYAFKAVDTSSLVRYSIIYTIVVAAISVYALGLRRQS